MQQCSENWKQTQGALIEEEKIAGDLVQGNAIIKTKVVQRDEFEKGDRRLLNFGHTLGHALENQYELSHGHAISIGMTYAANISEKLTGFKDVKRVIDLLEKYNLPTHAAFDKQKVFDVLKMDKKREKKEMNYVLLEKIGKGVVKSIPITKLEKIIQNYNSESNDTSIATKRNYPGAGIKEFDAKGLCGSIAF